MADPANPAPRDEGDGDGVTADEQRFAAYAAQLADAVEAELPGWVEAAVARVAEAWKPGSAAALHDDAAAAGAQAADEVGPKVRALLETDVDQQRAGPLSLLRTAVTYPTGVLRDAGVPPVVRDDFATRAFPDDVYDLAPASFADVSPALHEPGLVWGAAKAHVVLTRRRAEGLR